MTFLSLGVAVAVAPVAWAQEPDPGQYRIYQPQFVAHQATTATGELDWGPNVITNTTSSGEMWTLRREFTYGDAGITILLMAVLLLNVLTFLYQVVRIRYDW